MRLPARTTKYFPVRNKDPAPNIVSVPLTMTFVDSPRFRTALVEPTESDEAATDDEEPTDRVPDDTLKSILAIEDEEPKDKIPACTSRVFVASWAALPITIEPEEIKEEAATSLEASPQLQDPPTLADVPT